MEPLNQTFSSEGLETPFSILNIHQGFLQALEFVLSLLVEFPSRLTSTSRFKDRLQPGSSCAVLKDTGGEDGTARAGVSAGAGQCPGLEEP